MVLNETYYREDSAGKKTWFNPADVELTFDDKGRPVSAKLSSDGQAVQIGGTEKMSKSKNNGIDPQAIIDQYGADTARLFTMFASPPEQTLEWSGAGVEGAHRFLRRVWNFAQSRAVDLEPVLSISATDDADIKTLRLEMHKLLQQADHDYSRLQYNTVVSASMKMLNLLEATTLQPGPAARAALGECVGIFLRVLYPVAPHLTHSLWTALGYAKVHGDLLDAPWPQVDSTALEQSHIELMVQVNGKLRGKITVAKAADKASIEAAALSDDNVKKFVEGAPKKIIIVPGKLVNIVA
jgi:leucyl-tRNA synthetase